MTKSEAIQIVKNAKVNCIIKIEGDVKKECVFFEYLDPLQFKRIGLIEMYRLYTDTIETKCIAGVQKELRFTQKEKDFENFLNAMLLLRESIGEKTIFEFYKPYLN